jgi:hypothetical protein
MKSSRQLSVDVEADTGGIPQIYGKFSQFRQRSLFLR